VVSSMEDPNPKVAGAGHARLAAAGIEVDIGVGAQEARRDHAGHIRRVRDGRPHVMLKLAVSADGKVAAAGRRPLAITGGEARDRVHLLRAQSDAIMIGIGTALADDPLLTCRLPGMDKDSPIRVVLDGELRLPEGWRLTRTAREVPLWVIAGTDAPLDREQALSAAGAHIIRMSSRAGQLDISTVLKLLADRGITRLMVEGGPTLAASLVAADLIDEAMLFRSTKIIGTDGIDALEGLPLAALTHSPRLERLKSGPVGADIWDVFERK
jgi:diaminohydroxyphosphoribosylaminopyrimidine deaminase / 5-amino-6-(5-phosphoribosylamino)uracil reductase